MNAKENHDINIKSWISWLLKKKADYYSYFTFL